MLLKDKFEEKLHVSSTPPLNEPGEGEATKLEGGQFFCYCIFKLCHYTIDLATVDKIISRIREHTLDRDIQVGNIIPWSFCSLTRSADLLWCVS
jgi:hypothetical protein